MAEDVFILDIVASKAKKGFPRYRTSSFRNGISWENMSAPITRNEALLPFSLGHEKQGTASLTLVTVEIAAAWRAVSLP